MAYVLFKGFSASLSEESNVVIIDDRVRVFPEPLGPTRRHMEFAEKILSSESLIMDEGTSLIGP